LWLNSQGVTTWQQIRWSARIDTATKAQATEALAAMGLSVSDAIRLLLVRVAADKELPFPVKVPNATTRKAMAELEQGKGKRFASTDELFKDLGI
jgi:DNA-damage-inducible protein J